MTQKRNPVICALDTTDIAHARTITKLVAPYVGAVKLGLEFFTANGIAGVNQVAASGIPVFLDLKFHDIPNTVAGAIRATASANIFMMTIHTAGGKAMMHAAAKAAAEVAGQTGKPRPLIIGVTVLTSLDGADLQSVGVKDTIQDQVRRLAELAQECELDGVVCSSHEIRLLKQHCGKDFKLVVPGIRPADSAAGDQKRVMQPHEALMHGADYLVIGRPITQADHPAEAARHIINSLHL